MIWTHRNGKWTAYQGAYFFVVEKGNGGYTVRFQHIPSGRWDNLLDLSEHFEPWETAAIAMDRAEMFARLIGAL